MVCCESKIKVLSGELVFYFRDGSDPGGATTRPNVLFLFYKYASFNSVGFPVLCVSAFPLSCGVERHVCFPLLFKPNYTATPVCVFWCALPPGFTSPQHNRQHSWGVRTSLPLEGFRDLRSKLGGPARCRPRPRPKCQWKSM